MAVLVAIGYGDETAAAHAAEHAEEMTGDLFIEADDVAVIIRDGDGRYRVQTNHQAVGAGATWGMFWEPLFGSLFFVPVLGMAVGGGLAPMMGRVEKLGIDADFQDGARGLLQPGTSALFMFVDDPYYERALETLARFGGTALQSSVSSEAESELQEHLHGEPDA